MSNPKLNSQNKTKTNNQLKPQDLRYGNLIEFDGKIFTVKAIDKHIVTADRGKGNVDFTYSEINPIPLTEEILLKAGFNNNGLYLQKEVNKYFTFKLIAPKSKDNPFHFMPHASIGWGVDLYEVNQLQNLFYSLTGEELKINLK